MKKESLTYEEFMDIHACEEGSALLLKSLPWPVLPEVFSSFDAKGIICQSIDGRRRMRTKAPSWYGNMSLVYPTRLCTEQCSSEATAKIKAALVERILDGKTGKVADLTSGLGMDVAAFSRVSGSVLYNDMDPVLVAAARHNFSSLGLENIIFENRMIAPGMLDDMLKGEWYNPDIIFIDPARRSDSGKKVFLLEECQPDVLSLLQEIHSHSRHLVMKLSPMADISMAGSRLEAKGAKVREVHVIASKGECKELLIWTDSLFDAEKTIHVHEDSQSFSADYDIEKSERPVFFRDLEQMSSAIQDGLALFEGSKAITKAGLFNHVCQRFSLVKAGGSTHLYFCPTEKTSTVSDFGKVFQVLEIVPFSGKTIKDLGKRYPEAEVSSRNLPISSDALRKKLGVRSSSEYHIFAFRADFSGARSCELLVAAKRNMS